MASSVTTPFISTFQDTPVVRTKKLDFMQEKLRELKLNVVLNLSENGDLKVEKFENLIGCYQQFVNLVNCFLLNDSIPAQLKMSESFFSWESIDLDETLINLKKLSIDQALPLLLNPEYAGHPGYLYFAKYLLESNVCENGLSESVKPGELIHLNQLLFEFAIEKDSIIIYKVYLAFSCKLQPTFELEQVSYNLSRASEKKAVNISNYIKAKYPKSTVNLASRLDIAADSLRRLGQRFLNGDLNELEPLKTAVDNVERLLEQGRDPSNKQSLSQIVSTYALYKGYLMARQSS